MAKYNSGKIYNEKSVSGGANYNSALSTTMVLDNGTGNDIVENIITSVYVSDTAIGDDNISGTVSLEVIDRSIASDDSILVTLNIDILDSARPTDNVDIPHIYAKISDSATGADGISLLPTLVSLNDFAKGNGDISLDIDINVNDSAKEFESLIATAKLDVSDSATGIDEPANIVGAFFVIDSNSILHPLGVLVTGDSRYALLPSTRDNTEEITGRHGEIDFGTEFRTRLLELSIATNKGYELLEKARLKRLFAEYLDPTKGYKTLIFSDDVEKTYMVKYSGKIDITNHPSWFEFVIPFKMGDPFIVGSLEKRLTGNGILLNSGTFETGLIIEITGPTANPSLNIGKETISYNGTIPSGQNLIINTDKQTVRMGSSNAIANYDGTFPMVAPGKTAVAAPSNVTIKWRDKWI